jgi:hypothetical protein
MTPRARLIVFLTSLASLAPIGVGEARAADPRLVRVVLLRVADRMSLALEMSGEPQKAALRVLSARAIEVEAGPVSGLFREEQMAPASTVAFIRQVSIQKHTASTRAAFVRARITFDAPGAGNVRVVGRTVYVDLAPVATFRPAVPRAPSFTPRPEVPAAQPTPAAQPAVAAQPAPSLPPAPAVQRPTDSSASSPTPVGSGSYMDAVRPLVARLTEIGPFLAAAVAAPADDVLMAVGGTLAQVEQPLRAMNVPQASQPLHNILLSAVTTASRAVAPDFRGDRVVQVQRALALLDAAKSELR